MKLTALVVAGALAAGTVAAVPAEAQRHGYGTRHGYNGGYRYRGYSHRYYGPRGGYGYRGGYRYRGYGYGRPYGYGYGGPRVRCRIVRGYYGPVRRCFRR